MGALKAQLISGREARAPRCHGSEGSLSHNQSQHRERRTASLEQPQGEEDEQEGWISNAERGEDSMIKFVSTRVRDVCQRCSYQDTWPFASYQPLISVYVCHSPSETLPQCVWFAKDEVFGQTHQTDQEPVAKP